MDYNDLGKAVLAFKGVVSQHLAVALSYRQIVGVEWRVEIGLDDQPNSLPGGFAEVELEGNETVAGVGYTPSLPHLIIRLYPAQ